MLAIIGGTSLLESSLFRDLDEKVIRTPYGDTTIFVSNTVAFIQRHGKNANTPPHKINHKANIAALHQMGITRVVGLNSTGSLKKDIKPGTLLIPDDYFNLFNIPTFFDDKLKFTVPGFDEKLRDSIIGVAHQHDVYVVSQGIYFQVQGPILETPAEIRFIKQIGDVVGMTLANEAILAREMNIRFASICSVDNYANGITNTPLTLQEIDRMRALNLEKVEALLGYVCTELADD